MSAPIECFRCGSTPVVVPINVYYCTPPGGHAELHQMYRAACVCGVISKCRPSPEAALSTWSEPWQAYVDGPHSVDRPADEQTTPVQTECERLRQLLRDALDFLYAPEPHCQCHISPPCNDCVTNGATREMVARIKAELKASETGA